MEASFDAIINETTLFDNGEDVVLVRGCVQPLWREEEEEVCVCGVCVGGGRTACRLMG